MASLPLLKSTTLEGAFLEMAFLLQSGEINLNNKGVAAANFINIVASTSTQSIGVNATIPIFFGSAERGGLIAAAEYMANDYIKFTTNS